MAHARGHHRTHRRGGGLQRRVQAFLDWFRGNDPRAHGLPVGYLVVGILLFVGGMLFFSQQQTQAVLRNSFDYQSATLGTGRNDGGILFGAILAGLGIGVLFFGLSRLAPKDRLKPTAGLVASSTALIFLHLTIFVNSFAIPDARLVALRASFMFNDAADFLPIALFILTLATFLLLTGAAFAAMRLVTPLFLRRAIVRPHDPEDHRTRLVLLTLVVIASGAAFTRQFFGYALGADADPTGGMTPTWLTLTYYLIGITLGLALGTTAWRTYLLAWGDLRAKRSLSFRRYLVPLRQTENWLLGGLIVLHLIVFFARPIHQPDPATTSNIFAVNSKGVSIFLLLMVPLYWMHRRVERRWLTHLAHTPHPLYTVHRDRLANLAITLGAGWTLIALLFLAVEVEPLTSLASRLAFVAVVVPFFAIGISFDTNRAEPYLKGVGAPLMLLFAALVSILVGIMLWGQGNSVTTFYSRNGGFVDATSSALQPYSTGIRLLGSLFIAAPAVQLLWFMSARYQRQTNPGAILVAGFSIILAMNILFTINAESPTDVAIRQTEVLVGHYLISLQSGFDKAVVLGLWSLVAALGTVAVTMTLGRGTDRGHRKDRKAG